MEEILGVAIGLVLVFGVFAVVVSSATEAISGLVGMRAKVLVRGLRHMLGGDPDEGRAFVDSLYQDPLIVAISAGKASGPSYLDKRTFSTALLNVTNVLGSVDQRMDDIARNLDAGDDAADTGAGGVELPAHLKGALTELWEAADREQEKFVAALEVWFDQQMDRVSGWYGRWAQFVMFFVALALAAALNVSATTVGRTLWADPAVREATVNVAQETVEGGAGASDAGSSESGSFEGGSSEGGLTATDAAPTFEQLEDTGLPLGWTASAWPGWSWELVFHILGWVLIAVAGSFGAPIWFDLLNKLVNLRVAGKKPDDEGT